MIRLRACSLAIVLGLAACHSPSPARAKAVAPKTFDTPEAAITHYVTSVAAGDLDVALEATAAEEMAARYDFPAVARYVPAMDTLNLQAPTKPDQPNQKNNCREQLLRTRNERQRMRR